MMDNKFIINSNPDRPELGAPKLAADDPTILVSAIVSTYNSAEYIEGCILNLLSQTIADNMEIIVIDSASEQNEKDIVKQLMMNFANIRYLRTPTRETVYQAWNRGIKLAKGKYLTNANTDDRRFRDSIEKLVNVLENNPNAVLAYGNFNVVERVSEDKQHHAVVMNYPPYKRGDLLLHCYPGPMPVWRKEIHREFGLFHEEFLSAGDREFWVRISQKYEMIRVPEVLGNYLNNQNGIENTNKRLGVVKNEAEKIRLRYNLSFSKKWAEFEIYDLVVDNNFNLFIDLFEALKICGGAYRLNIAVKNCSNAQLKQLELYKQQGIINNLVMK